MIPVLELFPLSNAATARRCSCGCIATTTMTASGSTLEGDRAVFLCDRCAHVMGNGDARLRSVA